MSMYDDYDDYGRDPYDDDDYPIDGVGFASPGSGSALRAATADNPRDLPCPTCGWPNRLTRIDQAHGYQCDSCANALERGLDIYYYDPGEHDDEHTAEADLEGAESYDD